MSVLETETTGYTERQLPAVTLTMVAYNQEEFIQEAVESAFSQTYHPLRIIISDDCSTDRTYEIIQDLVSNYQGPHQVEARRNEKNLGLIGHYNLVFDLVETDYVVFCSGDDISFPNRVEVSMRRLLEDDTAVLVHSDTVKIDASGVEDGRFTPFINYDDPDPEFLATSEKIYIGATQAFRMDFYRKFGPIRERDTFEDMIYGFRAALLGGLKYIEEPLIKYRFAVGESHKKFRAKIDPVTLRVKRLHSRVAMISQRQSDLEIVDHPKKPKLAAQLSSRRARLTAQIDFHRGIGPFLTGLVSRECKHYLFALLSEGKVIATRFR